MGESNRTVTAMETKMLCMSASPCEAIQSLRRSGKCFHATRVAEATTNGFPAHFRSVLVLSRRRCCIRRATQRLAGEVVERKGQQGKHQDREPGVVERVGGG